MVPYFSERYQTTGYRMKLPAGLAVGTSFQTETPHDTVEELTATPLVALLNVESDQASLDAFEVDPDSTVLWSEEV
jgi:hypothetical protein